MRDGLQELRWQTANRELAPREGRETSGRRAPGRRSAARRRSGRWAWLAAGLLLGTAVWAPGSKAVTASPEATRRWLGPEGEALPFRTDDEVLRFLAAANVLSTEEVGEGITEPLLVVLEKDGLRMRAIFRYGDFRHERVRVGGRFYRSFRDRYAHEKAAYELARLLSFDAVPPVVLRRISVTDGSLQAWIEDSATEKQKRRRGVELKAGLRWHRQRQLMQIFDALISNFDRNQGNMLYDADWNLWCIDHTRSFLPEAAIPELERITHCERRLWEKLNSVSDGEIRATLEPYLDRDQIPGVMRRRDKLVRHLQGLIDSRGEEVVLFSLR